MADDLDPSMEVDVLAAMLRQDQQENADFLELLATKLEGALPDQTKVERKGGFFSKVKKVEKITVEFQDSCFLMSRESHGPVARKTKTVRGVQLSNKEIALDQWTRELSIEITKIAAKSATTRDALQKFIIGR